MSWYKILQGNCIDILAKMPSESVDLIFADPPYRLSNGGVSCKSGKFGLVDKGTWDRSLGLSYNHNFNLLWLEQCKRVLKPNGTIWVSGTHHIIFSIGFALQQLGFKILNEIIWYKPNAAPNLSCRYFTHSHETLIWAAKHSDSKHKFNYKLMKQINNGKQMRSVWKIPTTPPREKTHGSHPTQKPLALLQRIILSSTSEGDTVLDPFAGSSTTGVACLQYNRNYIGIELLSEFVELSHRRLQSVQCRILDPQARYIASG